MAAKTTREQLMQAAVLLFSQKGFSDTSIREIGARAGVTTSIIYHYFKNKEEMLFEIVYTALQDLIETLRGIEGSIDDPVDCFREMLTATMKLHTLKHKKEIRIVAMERDTLRGKRREKCRRLQREVYDIYLAQLKRMAEGGRLRDVDLTVLNISIFGTLTSFHTWHRERGRLSNDEVVRHIEEFIFKGILT